MMMFITSVSAVVFTITTVWLLLLTLRRRRTHQQCTGVVMTFQERFINGSKDIVPIINYTAEEHHYEFRGDICSFNMKTGSKVKVLYNKAVPSQALMKVSAQLSLATSAALAFCAVAGSVLVTMR